MRGNRNGRGRSRRFCNTNVTSRNCVLNTVSTNASSIQSHRLLLQEKQRSASCLAHHRAFSGKWGSIQKFSSFAKKEIGIPFTTRNFPSTPYNKDVVIHIINFLERSDICPEYALTGNRIVCILQCFVGVIILPRLQGEISTPYI